jgi:hypothetical protein
MANISIDVSTTPITYSPGPEVKQGDTVTFSLGSAASYESAQVSFPNGTCLTTSGPYSLGGATFATSPMTVDATAPKGLYVFEVLIGDERDRKNGGIDVTSDPPR